MFSYSWKLLFLIAVLHIAASFFINRLSYRRLASLRLFLSTKSWEHDGEIYNTVFRIRLWKDYVPSAGPFDKKDLKGDSAAYLSVFILETVRAEIAHIVCLALSWFVILSAKETVSWALPVFFTVINLPCILIQRYNRPRFERLLKKRKSPLIIPEEESGGLTDRVRSLRRK